MCKSLIVCKLLIAGTLLHVALLWYSGRMNELQSVAQKKRWSKVSKAKRTAMMRERGAQRQAKMTDVERALHAKRMVNARELKRVTQ